MDHYQTLGVDREATTEQIKAAYRRLARKYHPDVSKEADAHEKIKAINEAYAVLGDEARRAQYDRRGHRPQAEDFEGGGDYFGGGLHDLFDTLFSRGKTGMAYILTLTLEQAYAGGSQQLSVNGEVVDISIPAGVHEGDRIKSKDGRVTFQVRYAPHGKFHSENGHVASVIRLTPWEMALGGVHAVQTLGGRVQATLPAGLQPGQRIRLAGRGMPGGPHRATGDHWAQVEVDIPKATTAAQKKAYQALADTFKKK